MRYAVVNLNPHMLEGHVLSNMGGSYLRGSTLAAHHSRGGAADIHSKQMLDQEALTCLLVLLFLDQSKLHNNRLHRIIKNLSQHAPTRAWILASLLAIVKEMGKMSHTSPPVPSLAVPCPLPPPLTPRGPSGSHGDTSESGPVIVTPHHYPIPHWLDISINAALGSHAKIFQFDGEQPGKVVGGRVNIHPLASTTISHNVLDVLIFLARHFGFSFLPSELLPKDKAEERKEEGASTSSDVVSNFWLILLKLDGAMGRKGKGAMKAFKYLENKSLLTEQDLFSGSIMGQLMDLFTHDIIRDNIALIDKLLRLLGIASGAIPRGGLCCVSKVAGCVAGGGELDPQTAGKVVSPDAEDVFEKREPGMRPSIVAPPLLSSIISVLTSGRCSEEGLEEATTLLTNLSKCSIPTREQILLMLLDGVRTIGHTLCSQIISLDESVNAQLQEQELEKQLQSYQQQEETQKSKTKPSAGGSGVLAGVVLPLAGTGEEQHVDHSHDLHLPTMEPLTCKGSQQSFFVRMLKVVCQLRESAQLAISAANKANTTTTAGASGGAATSSSQPETATHPTQPETAAEGSLEGATAPSEEQGQGGAKSSSMAMEVGGAQQQQSVFLQTLSQQLELEELWSILSQCVDALSHTEDPHAVFVLQPTVEAFFLVHANYKDDGQKNKKKPSHLSVASRFVRLSSSSHTVDSESNPTSPSPFSPLPSTPGPGDMDPDPFAHLPPDTAKFLKFAGK